MKKEMLELNNLGKYRIAKELMQLFESDSEKIFEVLDVGVTGPKPLAFWKPLCEHENFRLTGIDIDADSIDLLKKEELPKQVSHLEALSGYDIAAHFGNKRFDVVISTQVLEHMKYPERFIDAAFKVLKPGGCLLFCYDSGEFPRKTNALKEIAKDIVVHLTKSERYHDKDILAKDVELMLEKSGFSDLELRRYNIHPLKQIQNHEVARNEDKLRVLEAWRNLEEILNDVGHAEQHPERYLGAYFKALKS